MRDTARRVGDSLAAGETTLVLGGDCTVGIGTVAAHMDAGGAVGVVYFDTHADLNVPASVREGALDWMGMAHMLDEDGAAPELVGAGALVPLLSPSDVVLFAWGPGAGDAVRARGDRASRLRSSRSTRSLPTPRTRRRARASDGGPLRPAARPLRRRRDRLHRRAAVGERGRNEGLAYDAAMRALAGCSRRRSSAALTMTELNPDHAEPGSLERFAREVGERLA